jgi:cytochrome c oxidase subunit II
VRYWSVALLALRAVLLSGCGAQSPLDPHGPPARDISTLFWWMLAVSAVVILGALGLLAVAWWRRGTEGLPLLGRNERASTGLVIGFGVVIPLISLCVVFAVANLSVASNTDAPRARTTSLTVEVIGHQWFWEVRYPGTDAVTANEIHIPARTRVNVVVRSADVIHSFWAPQLNRKVDAVPGRSNRLLLYADEPGRYRGDCAELCGIQHAHGPRGVRGPARGVPRLARRHVKAGADPRHVHRDGSCWRPGRRCSSARCWSSRTTAARARAPAGTATATGARQPSIVMRSTRSPRNS